MSKEKAKELIEETQNFLDAVMGLGESDVANVDKSMELLEQALKELED